MRVERRGEARETSVRVPVKLLAIEGSSVSSSLRTGLLELVVESMTTHL